MVAQLNESTVSRTAIWLTYSTQFGVCRETIRRYIARDTFPEIAERRPRLSILDPWKPHVRPRWDEDCHNDYPLWQGIKTQGYRGLCTFLSAWVRTYGNQQYH